MAERPGEEFGRWPANTVWTHSAQCVRRGTKKVPGVSGGTGNHNGSVYGSRTNQGAPVKHYADPDGLETIEDWECVDGCPVAELDSQSGPLRSGGTPPSRPRDKTRNAYGTYGGQENPDGIGGSEGNASRFFLQTAWTEDDFVPFFYCAKTGRDERNAGLTGLEAKQVDTTRNDPNAPGCNNPRNRGGRSDLNHHPTVKPLTLMRHLVRLVTPPEGVVLDPFMGSGSTGAAAVLEGVRFMGVELEADYYDIAKRRIDYYSKCRIDKKTGEIVPPRPEGKTLMEFLGG